MFIRKLLLLGNLLGISLVLSANADSHSITEIVAKVKPSVVGVGLYDALGVQTHQLQGTGFVFGDGTLVATNYHVIDKELDPQKVQYHIVFTGTGRNPKIAKVEIIARDREHDLAILKLPSPLTPLTLSLPKYVEVGTEVY